MFQSEKGFKKEDLKFVAEEIGEVVQSSRTVSSLKNIILDSYEYKEDPYFVQDILRIAIAERKLGEQREEI